MPSQNVKNHRGAVAGLTLIGRLLLQAQFPGSQAGEVKAALEFVNALTGAARASLKDAKRAEVDAEPDEEPTLEPILELAPEPTLDEELES